MTPGTYACGAVSGGEGSSSTSCMKTGLQQRGGSAGRGEGRQREGQVESLHYIGLHANSRSVSRKFCRRGSPGTKVPVMESHARVRETQACLT